MEKKIVATYQNDSKRYHRFDVNQGQGVVGAVYIPRGEDVPDRLIVELRTKADDKPSGSIGGGISTPMKSRVWWHPRGAF